MNFIKDKKIAVLGAQKSGLALVDLILKHRGNPLLSDTKSKSDFDKAVLADLESKSVQFDFSGHTEHLILSADAVVCSPGINKNTEVLLQAEQKGIPVYGEVEFANQFNSIPIIAITGSNGKTTVSTLIHRLIEASGKKSILCGNIGRPFSSCVNQDALYDFVVLEISSFQLETMHSALFKDPVFGKKFQLFKPYLSILLNFSDNHLDRHKDLNEYLEAKWQIFLNQDKHDHALINEKLKVKIHLMNPIKANTQFFSFHESEKDLYANENVLVLLKVAELLQIDPSLVQYVLSEFKGVEHRLEWIRNIDGVDYINDSKSTTAESGRWALNHFDCPIILICGGRDKNIDFNVLIPLVQKKVKKMIVYGEASDKLKKVFEGVVDIERCENMKDVVQKAKSLSQRGDCVLLSPMCASFDMFKNFEERGKVFKSLVLEI